MGYLQCSQTAHTRVAVEHNVPIALSRLRPSVGILELLWTQPQRIRHIWHCSTIQKCTYCRIEWCSSRDFEVFASFFIPHQRKRLKTLVDEHLNASYVILVSKVCVELKIPECLWRLTRYIHVTSFFQHMHISHSKVRLRTSIHTLFYWCMQHESWPTGYVKGWGYDLSRLFQFIGLPHIDQLNIICRGGEREGGREGGRERESSIIRSLQCIISESAYSTFKKPTTNHLSLWESRSAGCLVPASEGRPHDPCSRSRQGWGRRRELKHCRHSGKEGTSCLLLRRHCTKTGAKRQRSNLCGATGQWTVIKRLIAGRICGWIWENATFWRFHQNWDFAIFSIYTVWVTNLLSMSIYSWCTLYRQWATL